MSDFFFWVGVIGWSFWTVFKFITKNGEKNENRKRYEAAIESIHENHLGRGSFGFSALMRARTEAYAWAWETDEPTTLLSASRTIFHGRDPDPFLTM